ncbi:membrane protein insertase YidC [Vagococcus silagei]|uniref:Membrane protein insertase YidC n=1 Tax=Vagococcus silagei TaxID=2508885 RepID=A0A4V3TV26_9ENTE|nr:membrane protein insertase YidC [Vagococcus silagei]THB61279.1 membrane protein insertase YidC [Vagococcus silagei]
MKNIKRWFYGSGLFALVLLLSGCVKYDKSGNPVETGLIYRFLVKPMIALVTYLAEDMSLGYGMAIIILTLIVRIIILPLGLSQMKKSMIQQEKMQAIKPHMDVINDRIKAATTPEQQREEQMALQSLYKDNGINLIGGMGCLPLLIQMPIFAALFSAAKTTPGIQEAVFLNFIPLGKPSMILVALAGISYFAQSFISMIGMNEEQKKQMKMMTYVSPLMIIFISIKSPAGVTLYWVISGFFSCIQALITNLYYKPRIKKDIADHFEKNPIKVKAPNAKPMKNVTSKKQANANQSGNKNGKGRNAGKQQTKK